MLKRLAGPFRSYFNSRFSAVHNSIVRGQEEDRQRLDAALGAIGDLQTAVRDLHALTERTDEDLNQTLVMVGRTIDDLAHRIDAGNGSTRLQGSWGDELVDQLEEVRRALGLQAFDRVRQGELATLGEYDAAVANFAASHDGWAAQAGLWFNPPLSVAHDQGGVSLTQVNERIAEIPFVFRELADLAPGARILDVGSTESTVALSLASLGFDVTAVDPRPYPLSHPRLTTFQGPVSEFRSDQPFDAVVLLSSIEHFGVGAYELPTAADADLAAMRTLWDLSRAGTRLVLTTPFGEDRTTELERTYTPERLALLLEGWTVEQQSYLVRETETTWSWRSDLRRLGNNVVVLVTATRAEDRP